MTARILDIIDSLCFAANGFPLLLHAQSHLAHFLSNLLRDVYDIHIALHTHRMHTETHTYYSQTHGEKERGTERKYTISSGVLYLRRPRLVRLRLALSRRRIVRFVLQPLQRHA